MFCSLGGVYAAEKILAVSRSNLINSLPGMGQFGFLKRKKAKEAKEKKEAKETNPLISNSAVGSLYNMAARILMITEPPYSSSSFSASSPSISMNSSIGKMEGEKWNVFELIRYMLMLILWLSAWCVRLLLDLFPSPLPSSGFLESIVPSAPALPSSEHDDIDSSFGGPPGKAIGRALTQVLTLVNDIPVTSRKYEFARDLADKIIEENTKQGGPTLQEINRKALSLGFARTLKLLNSSLHCMQRQQKDVETSSWPWRLIRMIPLYSQLMPSFENLQGSLTNLLQPQSTAALQASQSQLAMANNNSILAEKLAQELLWITNKLGMCSAMEEAFLQWSTATNLAAFSISAHPRVQGSLVKISALLFKEMAKEDFDISDQARFKSLILWLPLLCYAMNGVDTPVLSASEKAEVERVLEKTISSLSRLDQEVVLANWLHDYTFSVSDWPNLQNCYDAWCDSSRKLI